MKAYVPQDETGHEILNDPLKGYVSKKFDPKLHQEIEKQKADLKKAPVGFGKSGDQLLTERFNPNNKELNKIRF